MPWRALIIIVFVLVSFRAQATGEPETPTRIEAEKEQAEKTPDPPDACDLSDEEIMEMVEFLEMMEYLENMELVDNFDVLVKEE